MKYYDDKEGKREAPAFTHDTKLPPKPYSMMRMLGVAWQETHDLVENGKTIHAAQAKSSVECEAGE